LRYKCTFFHIVMKYPFLLIVICLLPTFLYPQDTINKLNPQGLKEGYWRKKDSTGRMVYEGHFRNGLPSGTFKYYYADGRVKAISKFSEDGKRSRTTTYFGSGKKMAEGIYVDEKKDSTWRFYSDYDSALLSEESYKNGKKDGITKTYYPGKGVAEQMTWKNGVKEGPWIQYYTDGTIKMKAIYHNDEKNGLMEAFLPTGKPMFNGRYLNGDPDGTWMYYDDKGNPAKKEVYDKGALVSSEEIKNGR
jgi:antitoxin component YwqK of YwqJK toxin-antitoxin module